jgi:DNA adenine methylase
MPFAPIDAPFPWFGGKRKVAREVWARFGDVANYVEPFFGSGAVLLGRPHKPKIETVNDADGYVVNFWRAIKADPEAVAACADNPVFESDLHARHIWLVEQRPLLTSRLEGDPDWYDAKIAGWWVWGLSCWICSGWCTGKGPWSVDDDGRLIRAAKGNGVVRQRPRVSGDSAGQGVRRTRPGITRTGQGVKRECSLIPWFQALADRLARVRICAGDWSRVCGASIRAADGIAGVFLDPPYSEAAGRAPNLYRVESKTVAHDVREWAIEAGKDRNVRIALCGYDGEHTLPSDWSVFAWDAGVNCGTAKNGRRERIWFSPGGLSHHQTVLFPDFAQAV